MAGPGSKWTLGNVVSTVLIAVTLVAAFFLTGENSDLGLFFVQRQALWNDGRYGVNFTFLLTWFTLLAIAGLPLVISFGLAALIRRLVVPTTPAPPGWDVLQLRRRLLLAAGAFGLLVVWAGVTGIVVLTPEWLSPLGGLASIALIALPALPLVPALVFEAVIPPSYVEGAIEGMHLTTYQNRTTLFLHVAGNRYRMTPSSTEGLGLAQGTRVALIATGFLKRVSRIARSSSV